MLCKKGKQPQMTPILRKLHWLPVTLRVKFKILLLAFKCLKGSAPNYLQQLISRFVPTRNLRSNTVRRDTLVVPRYKKRKYGSRAFSRIAPVLWNQLPIHIRQINTVQEFKSSLKTHYFNIHFNS